MSNIAEGFERGGTNEFYQFLSVAKGSTGELEAQLCIALDQRYISKDQFDKARDLAAATKRLIAGFMKYLRKTASKGQKYK